MLQFRAWSISLNFNPCGLLFPESVPFPLWLFRAKLSFSRAFQADLRLISSCEHIFFWPGFPKHYSLNSTFSTPALSSTFSAINPFGFIISKICLNQTAPFGTSLSKPWLFQATFYLSLDGYKYTSILLFIQGIWLSITNIILTGVINNC